MDPAEFAGKMATILTADEARRVEAAPLDDHHWTREAVRRYVEGSDQGSRPDRERRAAAWVLVHVLRFDASRAAVMAGYSAGYVGVAAARVNDWLKDSGLADELVEAIAARREREAEGTSCCERCRQEVAAGG